MKRGAYITGKDALFAKVDKITSPKGSVPGIRVGVVQSGSYPIDKGKGRIQGRSSPQVAQVAWWNEFGTKKKDGSTHIPSRPFLRNSIKDMIESQALREEIRKNIDATDPALTTKAANAIGLFMKGIVQMAMTDHPYEANAPFTLEQKKSTKPLIDTSHLRKSIDYEIGGPTNKAP